MLPEGLMTRRVAVTIVVVSAIVAGYFLVYVSVLWLLALGISQFLVDVAPVPDDAVTYVDSPVPPHPPVTEPPPSPRKTILKVNVEYDTRFYRGLSDRVLEESTDRRTHWENIYGERHFFRGLSDRYTDTDASQTGWQCGVGGCVYRYGSSND